MLKVAQTLLNCVSGMTCAPTTPSTRCPRGKFDCGRNNKDGPECVSAFLACDGVKDCANGYDERSDVALSNRNLILISTNL